MGFFDIFRSKTVSKIASVANRDLDDDFRIEQFEEYIINLGVKLKQPDSIRGVVSTKYGDGKIREITHGMMKTEIDYKPSQTQESLIDSFYMPSIKILQAWDGIGNYVITFSKEDLEKNDAFLKVNIFSLISTALKSFNESSYDTKTLVVEKYFQAMVTLENAFYAIAFNADMDLITKAIEFFEMMIDDIEKKNLKAIESVASDFFENLEVLKEMNNREEKREQELKEIDSLLMTGKMKTATDNAKDSYFIDYTKSPHENSKVVGDVVPMTGVGSKLMVRTIKEDTRPSLSDVRYPVSDDGVIPDDAILIGQGDKRTFQLNMIEVKLISIDKLELSDGTVGMLYVEEVINKTEGSNTVRTRFMPVEEA